MINDDLIWCDGNNFGDKLNPILYNKLTGRTAIARNTSFKGAATVMIGSILNRARAGDVVWGAGLARMSDPVARGVKIYAVRGPLTRDICKQRGVDAPQIYGDPALLLPMFYQRASAVTTTLGVIPHIVDIPHLKISRPGVKLIKLTDSVEQVIKDITECSAIISSSLHGLIVADAYGIPNAWVRVTDKVLGDGTKFNDHFLAVGRRERQPVNLSGVSKVVDLISSIDPEPVMFDRQALIDACPFDLLAGVRNVNK